MRREEKRKEQKEAMWPSFSYSTTPKSNLEQFLHSVTPNPPSKFLPKTCAHDTNSLWQPLGKDKIEYYTLGDLWSCYDEWSAYGAGTSVTLNSGENVTQYYVPYLSAIQLCTTKSVAACRIPREDSDAFETDSDESGIGSDKLSRSLSNNSSRTWDSISEDSSSDHDSSWSMKDRLGYLYFQYFEFSSPYTRAPFKDQINQLARENPQLMTLRSVDLSPASWMAVAWYPIYAIPSGKSDKDLSTCFLTFHTLSSALQDDEDEDDNNNIEKDRCCSKAMGKDLEVKPKEKGSGKISLSPFGLATNKMQGNLWIDPETLDIERITNLYYAADSWLKQLSVQHPDFRHFHLPDLTL